MHFVKRLRKHRRESKALEALDYRLVRRKDRMEDQVRRDVDRQLRLKDLVVAVSVARDLEARRHGEPGAVDHGEFGRLELEPPTDRVKELRPRLVIPRLLGRREPPAASASGSRPPRARDCRRRRRTGFFDDASRS